MAKPKKFYFIEIDSPNIGHFDEGWCYTEEYLREAMEDLEIDELTVWAAVREKDGDAFYCKDAGEVALKSDQICGKVCMSYAPRNGKNGICRHHRTTWTASDQSVTFHRNLQAQPQTP